MRRGIGFSGLVLFLTGIARAGPYSSGLDNINPGAIDPGIPGVIDEEFVNPAFVGWATGVQSYLPAPGVDPGWNEPALSLGPVTGDNLDIVSLGDSVAQPGQITLSFKGGIRNAAGPDFAVFENSFGRDSFVFSELAYVEVSSDGQNFARFPGISLTPASVGAYGSIDPTNAYNLAGKHANAFGVSYGTPFDLGDLSSDPLVQSGQVNLHGIQFVRLVDIPGDGSFKDSQNHSIYDAYPTVGSGGFDLEAIGVLNGWFGGDANLDGTVDSKDLGILAMNWQHAQGEFTSGDFNLDGVVNIYDLVTLAKHWQQTDVSAAPFSVAVPEPSASLVAAVLCAAALRRRNHR